MEKAQTENSAAGGASVLTEMLGVVRAADDAAKARIWCALNRNDWPDELAALKPANFDDMGGEARHMLAWKLMCEAQDAIGLRECLREWNRDTLPGEQFDAWWNNGRRAPATPNAPHEGPPEARRAGGNLPTAPAGGPFDAVVGGLGGKWKR